MNTYKLSSDFFIAPQLTVIDVKQLAEPSAVSREGAEPNSGVWPAVANPTPAEKRKVYPGVGSELFHGIKKD
jgi:hypothetical protein